MDTLSEQNSQTRTEKRKQETVTRRGFLKAVTRIGGTLAVEATLNPFEKITDWMADTDKVPEGVIDQRVVVMKKIVREIATASTPEDREKSRNVLWAWLKFNGAQVYAQQEGLQLTSECLTHFLYGEGETLDVTQKYKEAILKENAGNRKQEKPNITDDEIIADYMTHRLGIETRNYPSSQEGAPIEVRTVPKVFAPTNLKTSDEGTLIQKFVIGNDSIDIYNSLNAHTITVNAKLLQYTESVNDQGQEFYTGIYSPVQFSMYDRYDWSGQDIDSRRSTGEIMATFMKSLGMKDPDEVLARLFTEEQRDQILTIYDSDGKLLTDTEYGHEFDITGNFTVETPISISTPKELL